MSAKISLGIRITLFLLMWTWIILAESPFRKGGADVEIHYGIVLTSFLSSFLLISFERTLIWIEKIVFSILIATAGLLLNLLFTRFILDQIYSGDYEIVGNDAFMNFISYLVFAGSMLAISIPLLLYKRAREIENYKSQTLL